jgi:hypothetical protein
MRHSDSGRIRRFSGRRARVLLVASLSVSSFAVLAIDAAPASAGVTSHTLTMPALLHARIASHNLTTRAPALRLSPRVGAPGTWNAAIEVPGSAVLNTGDNAGILSISCTSSGNCSAGGNYTDGSAHLQTFVVNETGGTWGNAIEVPGTAALNVGGSAAVTSISCTSNGNCAAGGAYTDVSGYVQGFVVNETSGTWGNASEVVDPSAVGSANASGVASLSCGANGSCSAVGLDVATGGVPVGFALSETNGTWSAATEVSMTSTLGAGGSGLNAVSCSSPGNCGAEGIGVYSDASVHGGFAYVPFEVDESNGTWGSPNQFPGLSPLNVGLIATADAISCTSPGNCSAGGNYTDGLANSQAWVANETKGTWSAATEISMASNLGALGAVVASMSCSSAGNCGASGVYTTSSLTQDFVMSETNGSWGDAVEVPGSSLFVGGAATVSPNPISCSSAGNCSSGGAYLDVLGNYEAYVVTEKSGTWGNAIELPGSSVLNTGGGGQVTAISCSADSSCGLGGYYATPPGTFQALVTDMTPLFSAQAALSLTSTHGKVGTALKLTTSGGSGSGGVTYSVVDGSAKGCAISGSALSATSGGTCVVTATKAGDSTYSSKTASASVAMALPAKPRALTVDFGAGSSALTSAAKSELTALSKELVKGASITVTGDAKGNAKLARSRATVVASFLKSKAHATIKTVTTSGANAATVVTTKQ